MSDWALGVLTVNGEEVRRIKIQQGSRMTKKRTEEPLRPLPLLAGATQLSECLPVRLAC